MNRRLLARLCRVAVAVVALLSISAAPAAGRTLPRPVARPPVADQPIVGPTWQSLGSGIAGNDGIVLALAVRGQDIYAGGRFSVAGGVAAQNLARFNATTQRWEPVGVGVTGQDAKVTALAVVGATLIVGGAFTSAGGVAANNIAQVDLVTGVWSPLGAGVSATFGSASVSALEVVGTDVYVGGDFELAGLQTANGIARWSTTTQMWTVFGSGLTRPDLDPVIPPAGIVNAIRAIGADIVLGGDFGAAGGVPAANVARLSASGVFAPLGAGTDGPVFAVASAGSSVVVGGAFVTAGSATAAGIAQWNGSAWSPLGGGVGDGTLTGQGLVNALLTVGSDLIVGGAFAAVGGASPATVAASGLARWNGSTWTAVGAGTSGSGNQVLALARRDAEVVFGGDFIVAGAIVVNNIATVSATGATFAAIGVGVGEGTAHALLVVGADVYVGGRFTLAGGQPANGLARWNTTNRTWTPIGSGVSGSARRVNALALIGGDLYLGGEFTQAGGVPANNIARYRISDGTFAPLDLGIRGQLFTPSVLALEAIGADLYVGGRFTLAGNQSVNNVARWNTTSATWSPLGGGVVTAQGVGVVRALRASGSALFVGGFFTSADGVANHIARWNTATNQWASLGQGIQPVTGTGVHTILVVGDDVYVGGEFLQAGFQDAANIARWNMVSASWFPIGVGLPGGVVHALATRGDALFVGGSFSPGTGAVGAGVAQLAFGQAAFQPIGTGIAGGSARAWALAVTPTELFVGGGFVSGGGTPTVGAARVASGAQLQVLAPVAARNVRLTQ